MKRPINGRAGSEDRGFVVANYDGARLAAAASGANCKPGLEIRGDAVAGQRAGLSGTGAENAGLAPVMLLLIAHVIGLSAGKWQASRAEHVWGRRRTGCLGAFTAAPMY